MDEVELLRSLRFTWSKIAELIGVSRATLYKRLEEEGTSTDNYYSDISDNQLDDIIREIKHHHPNDGERLMLGHLLSHGIIVTRARLRGAIRTLC